MVLWEYGTPHKAGKRNDIEEMYDDIEEGFTLKEILHKHRHKALNIMHCVEKAAKILNNCSAIDKLILKKRRRDELLFKNRTRRTSYVQRLTKTTNQPGKKSSTFVI